MEGTTYPEIRKLPREGKIEDYMKIQKKVPICNVSVNLKEVWFNYQGLVMPLATKQSLLELYQKACFTRQHGSQLCSKSYLRPGVEKLIFTASGNHYRKPQLVILQRSMVYGGPSKDTSTTRVLPLRLRKYYQKGKERLQSQRTRKPAMQLNLLETTEKLHPWDLNNVTA